MCICIQNTIPPFAQLLARARTREQIFADADELYSGRCTELLLMADSSFATVFGFRSMDVRRCKDSRATDGERRRFSVTHARDDTYRSEV